MISNSIASFAITLLLTASTAAFGEDFSSPGGRVAVRPHPALARQRVDHMTAIPATLPVPRRVYEKEALRANDDETNAPLEFTLEG